MRAMLAPALVVATLCFGALLTIGCDEKSRAEKRAEELAQAASAKKAADSASAAQVDPAELKYRERKASLEKTLKTYEADQGRMLNGDTTVKPGHLRSYFKEGPEGDKASKELEEKLKRDGKDGVRLSRVIEPIEIRLAGNMEDAEVELTEERASKNTSGCFLYVSSWKFVSDKWVLDQLKTVRKVDCS